MPWSHDLAETGESLRQSLENASPEAFDAAVDAEARRRMGEFLDGIESYRRSDYRRDLAEAPEIWRDGTTSLRDFGAGRKEGRPLLAIPSLINRAHILDLTADTSLMRALSRSGWRPLLVDWDAPGDVEREFGLDDYIAGRLEGALDAAQALTGGGPIPVIGYCMGGLLALALAVRRRRNVSALALLATPWDFHAADGGPPPSLVGARRVLEGVIDRLGVMPLDLLQTMFFGLDPTQSWSKFRRFAAMAPGSAAAGVFVALEDWANDGVPLAGRTARECLFGWYLENLPAEGRWQVAGVPILPEELDIPALVVVPAQDRIVPPESAISLAGGLLRSELLTPDAGHIGMVVGAGARKKMWAPLMSWLDRHGGPP